MKTAARFWALGLVTTAFYGLESHLPQALACPMCKAALEEDPSKPMAFQASILFMLAMAMGVFGVMTLLLTVINRREMESLKGTHLAGESS